METNPLFIVYAVIGCNLSSHKIGLRLQAILVKFIVYCSQIILYNVSYSNVFCIRVYYFYYLRLRHLYC